MTPAVAAGAVISNRVRYKVAGADVTIGTADGTHPRIDLIVVTSSGALAVRAGTAAATPKPPARTANDVVLAAVYVPASDTTIATSQITDLRVIRSDIRYAFRTPDIILRPGIFGDASFVGPGGYENTGTFGQDRPQDTGSYIGQQFKLRIFGNGVGTDDSGTLVWAWDSLNDAGAIWRGNAAGFGGFRVEMVLNPVGLSFVSNPMRGFFGLRPGHMGATENPITSAINCVGVAFAAAVGDSLGSNNLSLIHNDGAGAPTEVALGSNFPVQNNVYRMVLEAEPNASAISYLIQNITNGIETSGTLSTNIPAAGTFLAVHAGLNKQGSDADVYQCDIMRSDVWLGTPYA
jgi:hypothetical protein